MVKINYTRVAWQEISDFAAQQGKTSKDFLLDWVQENISNEAKRNSQEEAIGRVLFDLVFKHFDTTAKKPTPAEIEAAQRFLVEKIELCELIISTHKNAITAPIFDREVLGLPFYQTMQNALAWCAEQEQKGE